MSWFYDYYKRKLKTYGVHWPPLTCTGIRLVISGHTFVAELRAHGGLKTVYVTAKTLDEGPEDIHIQVGTQMELPDYGITAEIIMVQGHPVASESKTFYGLSFREFKS